MTLETFKILIEGIQNQSNKTHELYKHGVDLLSFNEDYYREVVRPLMSEVFKEEGMDWINWYLYDRVSHTGKNLEAFDKDGNRICFDIPSLYDTIKEYLK
jgi:hypothetical protein